MLEDLDIGATIIGRDGDQLGTLARIVVTREDSRVTHVVVDPGLVESGNLLAPGGWEKPRSRVVSVAMITGVDEAGVHLACDEAELRSLPLFEQQYYVEAEPPPDSQHASWWSRFRLGDLVNYAASAWGLGGAPILPPTGVTLNEAVGSASIEEGAPVWRRTPHDEVGEVDRVLVDSATERVNALVIRRKGPIGDLASDVVILPVSAITDIEDGVVHVALSDEEIDHLEEYDGTE